MRRGFSIYLILFFGLGPLSALLKGSEDAWLPPCCRRHGTHHCAMSMRVAAMRAAMESGTAPMLAAPATCPLYPGMRLGVLAPAHALPAATAPMRCETGRRLIPANTRVIAYSRPSVAHAGRGPPTMDPS